MRKSLMFLLVSIFLISFVSAGISVSPSEITLNVMPGDVITKNITITTDGNLAVYLNATSEANITLNYSTPLIVESNKIIQVQFIIPTGIVVGSYDVYLTASTENTETITTVTVNTYSGGGTRTIYVLPDGSTTRIKPTINSTSVTIDLTQDETGTGTTDGDETGIMYIDDTETGISTGLKIAIALMIIGGIIVIGYLIKIYHVSEQVGEYSYE